MEKTCSQCGNTKTTDHFQVRKMSPDGLTASCKECLRVRDKKRANDPTRVAARKSYAKTDRGLEAGRRAKRAWIDRNKEKRAAHCLTWSAMKDGRLKRKACEKCGSSVNVVAHHDDYCKPLDIRWLCTKHHAEHHKAIRETKRREQ